MKAFKHPYVWWTLSIFVAYVLLNVALSNYLTTLQSMFYYWRSTNPKLFLSLLFTLTIAALIAVSMVTAFLKYQERKALKGGTVACATSAVGLAIGMCPLCGASVLPLVLSAIGITFTLGSLPFQGMELQVGIIALLGINLYFLNK